MITSWSRVTLDAITMNPRWLAGTSTVAPMSVSELLIVAPAAYVQPVRSSVPPDGVAVVVGVAVGVAVAVSVGFGVAVAVAVGFGVAVAVAVGVGADMGVCNG